jgi:hypothetical protein
LRVYKQVETCDEYKDPHQHMIEDERIYCQAVGKYLTDPAGISYKELKERWKENK